MSHVVSVLTALYQKAVPLFRPPYYLEYTITPRPRCYVVLFALRKEDWYVAHASVVYVLHDLTAVCDHVDSAIGHRVGSFLFLLHYRLAMECGVRLFTLDNMTDDPPRAARGIYSMLIWEEGREGEEIPLAYLDYMEGRPPRPGNVMGALSGPEFSSTPSGSTRPAALSGPEMVGVPYVPGSRLVYQAWNVALRRLRDRVLTLCPKNGENGDSPWSPSVREIMRSLFLPYHPMTLRSECS
jgi:hypothetical protein